jgi:DNA recombination protein Rad52
MSFTPEQTAALDSKLDASNVKSRSQAGRSVSYVEGWHVIAEANRIFGFDSWTRETVETRLVAERERKIGDQGRDGWGVSYIARVKVVVFAGDSLVTREGIGAGHGIDVDLGQAHESAVKEAETDAMKRAMMTFGNPFGLALYDKTQEGVEAPQRPAQPRDSRPVSSPAQRQEARPAQAEASPDGIRARMLAAIGATKTTDELEKLTGQSSWRVKLEELPEAHRTTIAASATKRAHDLARVTA